MARVTVELPGLLAPIVGGERTIGVEAETLRGALRALIQLHPALEVHLFDESGDLRRHVLCFQNRTNTRWLDTLEVPVEEGDVITLLQAVSGG